MSRNTILFWIRLSISQIYGSASEEVCRSVRIKAHEVSKIATNLLLRKNCAVQQILKAGIWFSQSIFLAFYFRDVWHVDTFSIVPVVVAQEVVSLDSSFGPDVVTPTPVFHNSL